MAVKNYILDTNVLLFDPESIYHFEDNTVIIPIGVIEELDKFKKDHAELGRNARQVSRQLDELRIKGDLHKGVPLQNGGTLKVRYNGNLESYQKETNIDLHVIHIANHVTKKEKEIPCIIVSRDINVRIRANALGFLAEDYESSKLKQNELDLGYQEVEVSMDLIIQLSSKKKVAMEDAQLKSAYPNLFLNLKNSDNNRSLLGKVSPDMSQIMLLPHLPKLPIQSKNRTQTFAINALLDKNISLVCISGTAGSGKTLLATACGFYMTEVMEEYERMLVSRPVTPLGNQDIGFIPGTIEEKMDPWMQPIYDAFDVISGEHNTNGKKTAQHSTRVQIEPLTYIRGRSIHRQFMIVDECQSLTPLETKTILTRAGEGTKIVLTGDVDQIDNPYVDKYSNGLAVVMNAFRDSPLAAHIVMSQGVRSPLAEESSKRL